MYKLLNGILLVVALAIVSLDAAWLVGGHFAIDARRYLMLFVLVLPLVGASFYYGEVRREEAISATLACAAFLLMFSAAADLLSYLLLTIAGPRIDLRLAAIDHAMGFSWQSLMELVALHPRINLVLRLAYASVMPQIAVLLLVLGWRERCAELYKFSLALAIGALAALGVWTAAPSFGAFSIVVLPKATAAKLGLVLGFDYGRALVDMLKHGPGFISPSELRGLVGFPSYHTVQVLLLLWYARGLAYVRWLVFALNAVVLVSIPVQGGHHLIDMVGGAVVTGLSIWLAGHVVAAASRAQPARAYVPTGAVAG